MSAAVQRWLRPSDLADRLGVDVRHLSRLVTKGVLTCKLGSGGRRYPWPESREAYLRYQIAESVGAPGGAPDLATIDLNTERAMLTRRQREEIELRMAEKSRALVPYQQMLREQEALFARVAAVVNRWDDDWGPQLVGLDALNARAIAADQRAALQQACFELVADADDLNATPDEEPPDDGSAEQQDAA